MKQNKQRLYMSDLESSQFKKNSEKQSHPSNTRKIQLQI